MATLTGGNGADSLVGDVAGNFNDVIYGNGGSDILRGLTANDLVYGGDGTDSVFGNDGLDTLYGDNNNDTIFGGNDGDRIYGGNDTDSLYGDAGADTLYGDAGTDRVYGGLGVDSLFGGVGADTLLGGNDADLIYGGNDGDQLFGDNGADTLYGDIGTDILYGGNDADLIYGGNDGDQLFGDAADDTLYGDDGNDLLDGGAERDSLYGGAGVDTLRGGTGEDWIGGGAGDDSLFGNDGNDTLAGGDGNDTLYGGAQMDYFDYRDSNAEVYVDIQNSSLSRGYAAGDITDGTIDGIFGSRFGDTLIGGLGENYQGNDVYTTVIYGGDGSDSIDGIGGSDSLFGDAGDDTVIGGTGNDLIYGGADNDRLYGGANNDTIVGGTGQDSLYGGSGTDQLFGGADQDRIFVSYTGALNDVLGAESVDGGNSGADNDTLTVDITGFGWTRIDVTYDPLNGENGTITFFGPGPAFPVIGTLTFTDIESLVIVCFTPGTRIMTARGEVAVEALQPGEMVLTRDNGAQPLRWVGQRRLSRLELQARPELHPIRIGRGALGAAGPERSMLVSPQHRVLIEGARAEMYFGESEVLVPAKYLVGLAEVTRAVPVDGVTYVHILFDRHEIVLSDGIWTESFQPAERTLSALDQAARSEVLDLFPELALNADAFPAARLSLKAHEAKVLVAGDQAGRPR
jgi:Ca2+-binding RTX toxin-like protein